MNLTSSTTRRIIAALFFVLVVGAGVYHWNSFFGSEIQESQDSSNSYLSQRLKRQSDERVKMALQAIRDLPKLSMTKPNNDGSRSENLGLNQKVVSDRVKSQMSLAYQYMVASRNSIYRESERKAILEQLAKDPETVEAASLYLISPKLVRADFGKQQAEARLYSIQLLSTRAEQGDLAPLEKTTRAVATALTGETLGNPGRSRDLEDLISSYFFIEQNSALNQMGAFVEKLGYRPELQKQFIVGIYLGLQSVVSKQEIIQRLEQIGMKP